VSVAQVAGEMIIYGAHVDANIHASTQHAQGMAYSPTTNRWHKIAPYPLSTQASTIAAINGTIIAWDYALATARYDPRSNHGTPRQTSH